MTRQFVAPHLVDFDPQLREAFITLESYLDEVNRRIGTDAGIYWFDGNGDPNTLPLTDARGGDLFIDRITGDVYRNVTAPYTRTSTAFPPEDESRVYAQGSMWWDGTGDPTLLQPPQRVQDYWLNTTTCDIFVLGA